MSEKEEKREPEANEQGEPKRVNLGDAMKRMLEQKKRAGQSRPDNQEHYSTSTKKMQSQIKKKPNNQKKRTGV